MDINMDSSSMPGKVVHRQAEVQTVAAKPRLKWTRTLHDRFVDIVHWLGGAEKATPKSVMRMMGVPGLTLYHLKSHLQKYRLAQSQRSSALRDADGKEGYRATLGFRVEEDRGSAEMDDAEYAAASFSESMLQMQLDVQNQLQEQIEVQKHLQLRIEAQGKYLQSALKKAEDTLAAYHLSPSLVLHQQEINKDCSNDSCLTASERSEKIKGFCSITDDQSEEIGMGGAENRRGTKRRSWVHDSPQSKRAACAQEQRSPEAPAGELLFDLNL